VRQVNDPRWPAEAVYLGPPLHALLNLISGVRHRVACGTHVLTNPSRRVTGAQENVGARQQGNVENDDGDTSIHRSCSPFSLVVAVLNFGLIQIKSVQRQTEAAQPLARPPITT
jgi:hypothetical protein